MIEPIIIGVDRGSMDHTALTVRIGNEFKVIALTDDRPFTATEIQMSMPAWDARLSALASAALKPMTDRMFEIVMGAPRRKRWDKYGAYHRRQLKKWRKSHPRVVVE